MKEIIYKKININDSIWFSFPQEENYSISLFGYHHNVIGSSFPFNGDILSSHIKTGKFLKIGNFIITASKQYIVLAIDQLGFVYGIKNGNDDYVLIDEPPEEFVNHQMKSLEKQFQGKELNKLSQLYQYVLK